MYEIDGDFGKVKLGNYTFSANALDFLMCFVCIGWHCCNELYRIRRKDGHTFPTILFTVRGEGRMLTGEREYTLRMGSIAVLEKGVPHEYFTPEGGEWEFYWIHPNGRACDMLLAYLLRDLKEERVFVSENMERYAKKFEGLMGYLENEKILSEKYVCSEVSELMYMLINDSGKDRGRQKRLSDEIVGYFERNYGENITIQMLSSRFFVSPAHLIRRFKREMGYTPYEYLTIIRITKACRLLEYTDMPVNAIAENVGIKNTGRFIEKFKSITGRTPAVYRKRYLGTELQPHHKGSLKN